MSVEEKVAVKEGQMLEKKLEASLGSKKFQTITALHRNRGRIPFGVNPISEEAQPKEEKEIEPKEFVEKPMLSPEPSLNELQSKAKEAILKMQDKPESGILVMFQRLKLNEQSCKDVASYFKKRSQIEHEYSKSVLKISQQCSSNVEDCQVKQGSFAKVWSNMLDKRIGICSITDDLSQGLVGLADSLLSTVGHTLRSRKQIREMYQKCNKNIQDSQTSLEKVEHRRESVREEIRNNQDKQVKRQNASTLFSKSPEKLAKDALDLKQKLKSLSVQYDNSLKEHNQLVKNIHELQFPNFLQTLIELDTELSLALSKILNDSVNLDKTCLHKMSKSVDGCSNSTLIREIDDSQDLLNYIWKFFGTKESKPRKVFGVELSTLIKQEESNVPLLVKQCVEKLEDCLTSPGIYRVSGSSGNIARLKAEFEKSGTLLKADADSYSGLLKLFLRELPTPLLLKPSLSDFTIALDKKNFSEVLAQIPKCNLDTLKVLLKHLSKISSIPENKMSSQNIAIVFGPTLFGNCPDQQNLKATMKKQISIVDYLIKNYSQVFE